MRLSILPDDLLSCCLDFQGASLYSVGQNESDFRAIKRVKVKEEFEEEHPADFYRLLTSSDASKEANKGQQGLETLGFICDVCDAHVKEDRKVMCESSKAT